ncbi:Pentatricopeptide repeat-containing protein PNM1, mitochondrial [Ananas comosus]|uniref:Pentatricopeptide repeat-containing protein PNM1, mitochondrial n=1 Tax=Ananas comosus TaxID=4615 RepID=A0A199VVM4_ANACO|nr:Pentatricopeptide repeat-containing protein PNM1, mitochondrial [Ananas comosus]
MWRRPPNPLHLRHLLLRLLPPPPPPPSRSLSTATASSYSAAAASDVARSIAAELTKLSSADRSPSSEAAAATATAMATAAPLDLDAHFSLHFSDVRFDTALLRDVLALSPSSGRAAADLYRHLVRRRSFHPSDASLALLVHHLSRRRDFKAVSALLSEFRPSAGPLSLSAALSRLARAGRPTHATRLFADLPSSRRDRPLLAALVSSLADAGFPGHAERAARHHAAEIFPDEHICTALVRGWSAAGKLDEALRLLGEARRGGFDLGPPAYNSILDCICRLCRKKDPLRLPSEAEKFLVDMEATGIPRDSETFRVLITNLCKIRRTEDAVTLFRRMGEWGCSPDADTYLALIRSLYQAARVSEGDEMIGWMRSAGFGDRLDRKAYFGFIKILCGIERVEHAMKVFRMMKGYGHAPGIKTYNLLIGKLATHNQGDRANAMFNEAVARGVPVTPQVYKVDKRYVKVKKEKKVKKRLTLPEKMAMKRRRLKKLRLSFVRKPRSLRRVI